LGGSNLKIWVKEDLLQGLRREFHIFDRDDDEKYAGERDKVNQRNDGSKAVLTRKRTIENYLHPDAVREAFGLSGESELSISSNDCVVTNILRILGRDHLRGEERKKVESHVKRNLNTDAVDKMTLSRLKQSDPESDIEGWLCEIESLAKA